MNFIQKSWHNLKRRFKLTDEQFFKYTAALGLGGSFDIQASKLLQKGYEQNVDVYAVINKIAQTSSNIPWVVERKVGDEYEEIENTTLHELMMQPNMTKGYTWEDINYQLSVYILASGNGYLYGTNAVGFGARIMELDVLPSGRVELNVTGDWFIPSVSYEFEIGNTNRVLTNEEVSHIRLFNPNYSTIDDSLLGLSPIQVASRVVKVGNSRWEADAHLLENRGAVGLITNRSDRPLSEEEARRFQAAFDGQTAGPHNFGKVKVSNANVDFVQMAMSSTDLELIDKGIVNLRAICNVFGLDSSLFNDPANKTFNNRKEAEKALYTNAVIPLNDRLAFNYNQWLVPTHFPGQDVRMRPDYSGIMALQEDFNEQAATLVSLKREGIITANEARTKLKMEESQEPNADELIISNQLLEDLGNEI